MGKIELLVFAAQFVYWIKQLIVYAIIGRIIMSWLSMGQRRPTGKFAYFLHDITEPFFNLARKIPHRIGMIDISPIITILGVELIAGLIITLIQGLAI